MSNKPHHRDVGPSMKVMSAIVRAVLHFGFGCLLFYWVLVSLRWVGGWSPLDLSFSQISVLQQTYIPYWTTHMTVLALWLIGLGLFVSGCVSLSRLLRRRKVGA